MKNRTPKSAFSLVELSIVILVIGIVLAGITQSSRLIRQFRLSSARTLTESSPVNSITDLVAWFDATKEESTIGANNVSELENEDEVLTWKSMNSATADFNVTATAGTGPQYIEEGINDLPALLFDNSDVDEKLSGDFAGYNSEWTMFIVAKKVANPTAMLSADIINIKTSGGIVYFSVDSSGVLFATNNGAYVQSDAAVGNVAFVTSAMYSSAFNKASLYINKTEQVGLGDVEASVLNEVTSEISIGAYIDAESYVFDGYIGEVIIYNRGLKTEERQAVEDYLMEKWKL